MNVYSSMQNYYCHQNVNAGPFKELIESYKHIINNNINFSTRPSSPRISIIDLLLMNPDLGPLKIWEILEEYLFLSDYELILIKQEDTDSHSYKNPQAAMNRWSIKNQLDENKLFQAAKNKQKKINKDQQLLDLFYKKQELDQEVEMFKKKTN